MKKLNTYYIESRYPQVRIQTVSVLAESVEDALHYFRECGEGTPSGPDRYEAIGEQTHTVYRQELIKEHEERSPRGGGGC